MEDKFESAALLMPTVALRGLVVFPGMQVHFDVGREKSIDALKAALAGDRKIFLTAQKDIAVDDPDFNDLYKLGVVATVSRVAKLPGEGDIVRVSVKGMYRARLNGIVSSEPHLVGAIRACAIRKYDRENKYGSGRSSEAQRASSRAMRRARPSSLQMSCSRFSVSIIPATWRISSPAI